MKTYLDGLTDSLQICRNLKQNNSVGPYNKMEDAFLKFIEEETLGRAYEACGCFYQGGSRHYCQECAERNKK